MGNTLKIKYGNTYIVNSSPSEAVTYTLPCNGKNMSGNIIVEFSPESGSERTELVPAMTSNTTPSGVCSASDYTTYAPGYAFNGTCTGTDDAGEAPSTSLPQGIQYEFPDTYLVDAVSLYTHADSGYGTTSKGYISYSTDGTTFTQIYTFSIGTQSTTEYSFGSEIKCKYIRCYITAANNTYSTNIGVRIHKLQYYGKKPA